MKTELTVKVKGAVSHVRTFTKSRVHYKGLTAYLKWLNQLSPISVELVEVKID